LPLFNRRRRLWLEVSRLLPTRPFLTLGFGVRALLFLSVDIACGGVRVTCFSLTPFLILSAVVEGADEMAVDMSTIS
jgi:hypothetical protein